MKRNLKLVFKKCYQNVKHIVITKKFDNAEFHDDANNFTFDQFDISNIKETIFNIFDKYAPIKQEYLRANEALFLTREMHREIMKRSILHNNLLGTKSQEDKLKYN